MIVDRDSCKSDLARAFQVFKCFLPFVAREPAGIPDMELLQVDRIDVEVAKALFRRFHDVVVGEHIFDPAAWRRRPDSILRRHLRRYQDPSGSCFYDTANELFAMTIT